MRYIGWKVPSPRGKLSRVLVPLSLGVALISVAGCGSSDGAAKSDADPAALKKAEREGAQNARQNLKIRQLQRQLKESNQTTGSAVPSAPPPSAPSSSVPQAASSYVASYTAYSPSDPNYHYVAQVPSGGGWSAPAESYPTGGELHRTSLRGPDGTLLIIDYTPHETPSLGGGYDAANTSLQTNFGAATEYIFHESEGLADCNGRPCADFFINDGAGGGWGVLGGGPTLPVAESIARTVAQSISGG